MYIICYYPSLGHIVSVEFRNKMMGGAIKIDTNRLIDRTIRYQAEIWSSFYHDFFSTFQIHRKTGQYT